MSLGTIIIHCDDSAQSEKRLDLAMQLARRHEAHISALALGVEIYLPAGMGMETTVDLWARQAADVRKRNKEISEACAATLAKQGVLGDARAVTVSEGGVAAEIARQARYGDLVIVGQPVDNDANALATNILEGALFESGRPALVVPADVATDDLGRRVVVAWDASRMAARALYDSLLLLEKAEQIDLVVVDPQISRDEHGGEPGADIALVLSRHDLNVTVYQLPRAGRSAGEVIHQHATDANADLIVMGAYGHARWQQSLLGGVTSDMLRSAKIPLLMSH